MDKDIENKTYKISVRNNKCKDPAHVKICLSVYCDENKCHRAIADLLGSESRADVQLKACIFPRSIKWS